MSYEKGAECVGRTIESLAAHIEFLSMRCRMYDNKRDGMDEIIELSSLMLQLSRTLNELVVTDTMLRNARVGQTDVLAALVNGGRRV